MKIPQGYKQTTIGIIPKDWEVKEIGEIFYLFPTASYSRAELTNTDDVLYMHYGDIHTKYNFYIDVNSAQLPTISDDKLRNYELVKEGDLIISDASEDYEGVGKSIEVVNIGEKKMIAGLHTFHIREKKPIFAKLFKGYVGLHKNVVKQYRVLATGTKVYSISKESLLKIQIPVPPLAEQEKIAEILSTWDKAIELCQKTIEELKQRNSSLLNKIINSNLGEKFELGRLGKTFNGLVNKTKEDFGSGKPYITYLNIFQNFQTMENFQLVLILEDENQQKIQYGDILFTVSSETPEEIGMSSVVLFNPEELYLNSFCFGLRLHNFEILLPRYASYYFRSGLFRRQIRRLAQGATRYNLSKTEFLKINITIPNIEEQERIANILDTATLELTHYEEKLVSLKLQKKGLMQQLLTGKVRTV